MIKLSKLAAVARATTKPKVAPTSPDQLDQEKMSRRAALRRIGMTSGIAVLGLLTIDDLARVASQKLEQNELTRGIAKDFKSAGVAFADTLGGPSPSPTDMANKPRQPTPPSCQGHNANASACKEDLHKACLNQRLSPKCAVIMDYCQQEAGIDDTDVTALVKCYKSQGVV